MSKLLKLITTLSMLLCAIVMTYEIHSTGIPSVSYPTEISLVMSWLFCGILGLLISAGITGIAVGVAMLILGGGHA